MSTAFIPPEGPVMPSSDYRLAPGQTALRPINMTGVDFSALEDDEAIQATAPELVRDQLVRTGEAVAWRAWEGLRARLKNLPGMKWAVLRPTRSEAVALGYMEVVGREFEREIVGARRQALEARAVRALRQEKPVDPRGRLRRRQGDPLPRDRSTLRHRARSPRRSGRPVARSIGRLAVQAGGVIVPPRHPPRRSSAMTPAADI